MRLWTLADDVSRQVQAGLAGGAAALYRHLLGAPADLHGTLTVQRQPVIAAM